MDHTVFKDSVVANFLNNRFVSFKVQMDQTASQTHPELATTLKNEYEVTAYPTYLFFDQNGKAVHKVVGGEGSVTVFTRSRKRFKS